METITSKLTFKSYNPDSDKNSYSEITFSVDKNASDEEENLLSVEIRHIIDGKVKEEAGFEYLLDEQIDYIIGYLKNRPKVAKHDTF